MRTALRMLTILAVMAAYTTSIATTIVVDWAGGGSAETIQAGIDYASAGDTVLVMPGIYSGEGNYNLDFGGKDCVLLGSGGAPSVTIDCGGLGRAITFQSYETVACVVEGFTITNGSQAFGGAMYFIHSSPVIRDCIMSENTVSSWGGAVICTSVSGPTFEGCAFTSNAAVRGGAVYFESDTTPSFHQCTFSDNMVTDGGGALWMGDDDSSPTFVGCDFYGNGTTGPYTDGGAAYISADSSPAFSSCSFSDNTATGVGGAVEIRESPATTFDSCSFELNSANGGGAVDLYGGSHASFDSCRFYDNTAVYEGGAVYSSGGSVPTFTDCTMARNASGYQGGAMYFYDFSTPVLTRCSLHANSSPDGSGIWCDDNFTLANCIIAFGVGGEAVSCDGDAPEPSCSDIYGNAGGDWVGCLLGLDEIGDNLSADPLFCDVSENDFTLDAASPCTATNAPGCGLIGAWDIGCDAPVQVKSWGSMKAAYR